jgi:hypothetical protein
MSITLNNDNTNTDINTAYALKTAVLQKGQQESEGEMAIKLIDSTNIEALGLPIGNSGQNINIAV